MTEKDTGRGNAILAVMKSDSMLSVGKEYLELGIDVALDSGALKEIPLVSTVVGIFNVTGAVKDQLLATKLIRF